MPVLMYDSLIFKVAIAAWIGHGPNEHAHARTLTVRRREEVGIVSTRRILSADLDVVATFAALVVVIELEVAGGFIKTILVENVMHNIAYIVHIGDCCLAVSAWILSEIGRIVENEIIGRRHYFVHAF